MRGTRPKHEVHSNSNGKLDYNRQTSSILPCVRIDAGLRPRSSNNCLIKLSNPSLYVTFVEKHVIFVFYYI